MKYPHHDGFSGLELLYVMLWLGLTTTVVVDLMFQLMQF